MAENSILYLLMKKFTFFDGAEHAVKSLANFGYELHFVSHKSKYGLLSSKI